MALSPLIFGCSGPLLTRDEAKFFDRRQPFGFILFSRNLESPSQITELCKNLRTSVGWNAPIFIDQEGGRVARLGNPYWFEFQAALIDAHHPRSERLFWLRGRLIAHNLISAGVDVNCAPLGDLAREITHPVLKSRCYGETVAQVVMNAKAMHQGLRSGGVSGVIKHLPGHGLAQMDSHVELPIIKNDIITLNNDFSTFRDLNFIEMAMTAHLVYSKIDATAPATQSKIMIDIVRNNIGFDNLLLSDDISMDALSGSVADRAISALAAGCDIVLHCNGRLSEMALLADTCSTLSSESAVRVDRAVNQRPDPISVDIAGLKAEFDSIINK
jgi:beta-N-acetylhexosaminidase